MRNWQKKGFQKWIDNEYNGIFSVVTGGGKTIFAIYCLSHLFENDLIDSAIIVVPTKTLQDQWASNIISTTSSTIDEISFNYKKLNKLNILTNISTQKIPFEELKNRYSIVLDECHRYGTSNNELFLKNNFVSKIGLTATLERKYDSGVSDILVPNIGEKIYDYDLKEALSDGVVENYKMVYLRTQLTQDEEFIYNELSEKIKKIYLIILSQQNKTVSNYDTISLENQMKMYLIKRSRVVNESKQRTFVATKIILNNLMRKKIVFCETITQAEEIKSQLKTQNLDSLIYHSKMKRSDRISVLNSFQSNYYHTLIGCKALDEGFDVPDIDFGIIVSQTKTNRQRVQRLGRTIRKHKDKVKPIIYTLYTTEDEYSSLYEEQFNNSNIEVEWKEVK